MATDKTPQSTLIWILCAIGVISPAIGLIVPFFSKKDGIQKSPKKDNDPIVGKWEVLDGNFRNTIIEFTTGGMVVANTQHEWKSGGTHTGKYRYSTWRNSIEISDSESKNEDVVYDVDFSLGSDTVIAVQRKDEDVISGFSGFGGHWQRIGLPPTSSNNSGKMDFSGLRGVLDGKWQPKIIKESNGYSGYSGKNEHKAVSRVFWKQPDLLDFTAKSIEETDQGIKHVGKYVVKDDIITITDRDRDVNVYGLEFVSDDEIALRPEAIKNDSAFMTLSGRWMRISLPPNRTALSQDSGPVADAKKQVLKIEVKLAKLEAIQKAALADRDDLAARLRSVGVNAVGDLKGNIRGQRIAENIAKLATEIGNRERQLAVIDGEILKAKSLVRRMEQEQAGLSEDEMRNLALQLREAEERIDGPSLPITPIDVNAAVENALRVMEKATVRQDPSSMDQATEKQDPKEITNSIGIKLMRIPKGKFMMGSPKTEEGREEIETQHEVTISMNFYMGSTEVTQAQWQKVMRKNPSFFKGDELPVERVSWDEAIEFCKRLSEMPEEKKAGHKYRLPTEAEWEYACRAGTTTPLHFGSQLNGRQANCDGTKPYGTETKGPYLENTTPVGKYAANAWGLYDMHGNVWEWCSDWYGGYPPESVTDPRGPATGSVHINRGGCWGLGAVCCRSADRNGSDPSTRNISLGFRVALNSPGIPK
jgi:formylglycine-generating enzyme required for sulfatase activity